MNRAVVIRAASGLADYLLGELDGVHPRPRVVIGYDARHKSVDFARDSAAVLTAVGIDVLVLPSALPTRCSRSRSATCSRRGDHGHRLAQPAAGQRLQGLPRRPRGHRLGPGRPDRAAGRRRDRGGDRARPVRRVSPARTERLDRARPEVLDAYVASVVALAPADEATRAAAARLRIVLTPLHGVGGEVAQRVLAAAGFTDVLVVPEQAEPDGDFPSIAFPNPEEPGAIDLAIGLASDEGADLVIALDPDADRCGVGTQDLRHRSFRGPDTAEAEGWRILHGDETGALLGATLASAGRHDPNGSYFASSIVSSRLLGKIAAAAGYGYAPTLTGFKWISRVDGLVFGYEEALGYCVDPAHVRDKDGISAALVVSVLCAHLKAQGRTVVDALDDLARAHGLHLTDQVSARFTDLAQIGETVHRLRSHPPASLGGSRVTEVVDLATGAEADRDGLPPTEGLRLLTADGTRVVVRPSGTEPKVKCYLEVVLPLDPTADHKAVGRTRTEARERLDSVAADMRVALGI